MTIRELFYASSMSYTSLFSHQCFSSGRHPGRSLLVQEAHNHGAPQICPSRKYWIFEFPNIMTLLAWHILSESLPLFTCLGLGGHAAQGKNQTTLAYKYLCFNEPFREVFSFYALRSLPPYRDCRTYLTQLLEGWHDAIYM